MKIIHLIADYGVGDPAFTEVVQKLYGLSGEITVIPTSVNNFSTIATAFWTYQLSMVNPVPGMAIYSNTAPRKDTAAARLHNEGEGFTYARLKNGVEVMGVNSGYCFSLVKPEITDLRKVNVANKGSQFRSRDFFPEAVIGIINRESKWLGEKIDPQVIPDMPQNRVAWIDGYGNLKTTLRHSQVTETEPGRPVTISLNGMKRTAFYTAGTFSVREGELAFAPGSNGGSDRFMEIFLRGLSAYVEFGRPAVESEFRFEFV